MEEPTMIPHEALRTAHTLECILLQLDIFTIFTSQRVCKHWKETIEHSAAIQTHLFLKAEPQGKAKRIYNPLLHAFVRRFWVPGPIPFGTSQMLDGYFQYTNKKAMAAFSRVDASWRKMLVQQPPNTNWKDHDDIVEEGEGEAGGKPYLRLGPACHGTHYLSLCATVCLIFQIGYPVMRSDMESQ
ncbi:hypothetical protein BDV18DRAFT_155533 [Aspergillus unguis]